MTDTPTHQPEVDKDRRTTMMIYMLYFVGFVTGISTLAGVVIAHIKVDEVADPWRSHMEFLIRTFWYSVALVIVGMILMLVMVGWILLALLPFWMLIRCVKGFLAANDGRPIDDPKTMLW